MGWTDALGPPKVEVGYRGQGADGKVGEQDGWGGVLAAPGTHQRGHWSGWGEGSHTDPGESCGATHAVSWWGLWLGRGGRQGGGCTHSPLTLTLWSPGA